MTNSSGTSGFGVRVVQVPVYWLAIGIVTCLLSPVLAVVISVRINNATIAENERQRTESRAQSRAVVCALATTQLDAFADAQSDVGKASYRGWLDMYKLSECKPTRK